MCNRKFINYQLSVHGINYRLNINGACSSNHVHLCQIFQRPVSRKKVIVPGKFVVIKESLKVGCFVGFFHPPEENLPMYVILIGKYIKTVK